MAIARALVHKPKILLADEPTGNLDPDLSAEIMRLFEQFSQVGVTTLIASHDIALIRRLGHRVLGLEQGHWCTTEPSDVRLEPEKTANMEAWKAHHRSSCVESLERILRAPLQSLLTALAWPLRLCYRRPC